MVTRKDNREKIDKLISDCGTEYIEINEYRKKRSLRQNDLYWSVVTIAAKEKGYSKEELHEIFRSLFIPVQKVEYNGFIFEVRKSTSKMDVKEFSEYLDCVYSHIASEGIEIPNYEDYGL